MNIEIGGIRQRRAASAAVVMAVVAGVLALGACAPGGGDAVGGNGSALPPVIVDVNEVDGTTVEVDDNRSIDLTGDDETFAEWTAEISDPAIVEFTPGRDDGSAQYNPGLTATAVGETEVTLENGATGDSVSFTVQVVPDAE